jgi:hypothetical protein
MVISQFFTAVLNIRFFEKSIFQEGRVCWGWSFRDKVGALSPVYEENSDSTLVDRISCKFGPKEEKRKFIVHVRLSKYFFEQYFNHTSSYILIRQHTSRDSNFVLVEDELAPFLVRFNTRRQNFGKMVIIRYGKARHSRVYLMAIVSSENQFSSALDGWVCTVLIADAFLRALTDGSVASGNWVIRKVGS